MTTGLSRERWTKWCPVKCRPELVSAPVHATPSPTAKEIYLLLPFSESVSLRTMQILAVPWKDADFTFHKNHHSHQDSHYMDWGNWFAFVGFVQPIHKHRNIKHIKSNQSLYRASPSVCPEPTSRPDNNHLSWLFTRALSPKPPPYPEVQK